MPKANPDKQKIKELQGTISEQTKMIRTLTEEIKKLQNKVRDIETENKLLHDYMDNNNI